MSTTAQPLTENDPAALKAALAEYRGEKAPAVRMANPEVTEIRQEAPPTEEVATPPAVSEKTEVAQETTEDSQVKDETPKPSRLERRMGKLTADRDSALSRAEQAEARARELETKLEEAKKTPAPGPSEKPATTAPVGKPQKPDLSTLDYEQQQTALLKYADDLADWSAAEAERKVEERERTREAKRLADEAVKAENETKTKWQAEVARGLKANPDFAEICDTTVGPVLSHYGLTQRVVASGIGPELMIYLDEHPDELGRLKLCTTVDEVAEFFGETKATVKAELAKKKAPVRTAVTEPIPPPVRTPGGSGQGKTLSVQELETLPFDQFSQQIRQYQKPKTR